MERTASEAAERAVVMRTMLLDAIAAQATGLLAAHGVAAILLKGRVTASWLYSDDGVRNYVDVDLLIDPDQQARAIEVLATIGYRHWLAGADEVEYGSNELDLIGPTGVCIDLHHALLGIAATPQRCWEVLSHRTEEMSVGGRNVTVLDTAARTMHLALHVAQNGPADTKAVADLERGLAQLPLETWQQAERIARSVDAIKAFSAGLHAIERGRRLAADLGLAPPRDVELVLRSWSAPPEALQIQRFVEAKSMSSRLRLVGRKLWPTAAYMYGWVPAARAGPRALLIARLRRMAGLPSTVGVALSSWRRARRAVRRQAVQEPTSTAGGRST